MKGYKEKNKQDIIQGIIQNRRKISFKVLEELEADEILEDYDLIRVVSDCYKDTFMFYLYKHFYLINRNRNDFREIDRNLIRNRYFLLDKCLTNSIQEYIQINGENAFNNLSTAQFIKILLGNNEKMLSNEER